MEAYLEVSGALEAVDTKVFVCAHSAARGVIDWASRTWHRCCRRRWGACDAAARCPVLRSDGASADAVRPAAPAAGEKASADAYNLLDAPWARARQGNASPRKAGGSPSVRRNEAAEEEVEDFYDAMSESEDDCAEGWRSRCLPSLPSQPGVHPGCSSRRAVEVQRRLHTLLAIERRCRGGDPLGGLGGAMPPGDVGASEEFRVERVLAEDNAQMWFCHTANCPYVIGCLRCLLEDVHVGDVVEAIQDPKQRLAWDGDSFASFELLQEHDEADPTREDVVFTVMPAPRPIRDREILQRRWQLAIGSDGAQALIMQSFQDDKARPPDPRRVRAFTHLSGYLLRPAPGAPGASRGTGRGAARSDVEVVVISQCDLGGALPGWFQNMARRLAKRRGVEWGRRLQGHCRAAGAARAEAA